MLGLELSLKSLPYIFLQERHIPDKNAAAQHYCTAQINHDKANYKSRIWDHFCFVLHPAAIAVLVIAAVNPGGERESVLIF